MVRAGLLVVTLTLLVLSGALAGCNNDGGGNGTGGGLSLEDYFAQLDALDNAFEAESDALDEQLSGLADEDFVTEGVALLGQQAAALREFGDGVAALEPPDEAADAHDDAVAAFGDVTTTFDGIIDDLEGATSPEDFFALFDNEEFDAALQQLDAACFALQGIADGEGIAIDLNCPNEEET